MPPCDLLRELVAGGYVTTMSNGNGTMNGGNGRLVDAYKKPLTVRERVLVESLINPFDNRSKEDKAVAAGYKNGKYVFELIKKPHIAEAIRIGSDQVVAALTQIYRGRVIKAVADRAIDGNSQDARTFLQVSDDISTGQNIHLTQVQTNEAETRKSRKGRLTGRIEQLQGDS